MNIIKSAAKYIAKIAIERDLIDESEKNMRQVNQNTRVHQERISYYMKKIDEEKKILTNALENAKIMSFFIIINKCKFG